MCNVICGKETEWSPEHKTTVFNVMWVCLIVCILRQYNYFVGVVMYTGQGDILAFHPLAKLVNTFKNLPTFFHSLIVSYKPVHHGNFSAVYYD